MTPCSCGRKKKAQTTDEKQRHVVLFLCSAAAAECVYLRRANFISPEAFNSVMAVILGQVDLGSMSLLQRTCNQTAFGHMCVKVILATSNAKLRLQARQAAYSRLMALLTEGFYTQL